VLRFDDWTIDLAQRRLWSADDVVITLTTAEFDLLSVFVTHPRRTLSRDQLLDLTQGNAAQSFDRSIDILVSRLRRKLAGGAKGTNPIVTVRGGGYMFSAEVRPQ
jgi:two-component system OmpR family response regulator